MFRDHEIDKEIGTPNRDHVRFPGVDGKKTTIVKKKTDIESQKRRLASESLVVRNNSLLKKRKLTTEGLHRGRTAPMLSKQKKNLGEKVGVDRITERVPSGLDHLDVSRKTIVNKTLKKEVLKTVEKNNSLGNRLFTHYKGLGSIKRGKQDEPDDVELHSENISKLDPSTKALSAAASLDPARERRLVYLTTNYLQIRVSFL